MIYSKHTEYLARKYGKSLPHALIVAGESGLGVVSAAIDIAREYSGREPVVIHPKIKTGGKAVEDPSGTILIDDIRYIQGLSRGKSGSALVFVLDTGQKPMTTPAQNAFLKLLEEPADNTHFILACHDLASLLPTVLSRAQRIDMTRISDTQTNQLAGELAGGDQLFARQLSFIARGRPALMKSLVDTPEKFDHSVKIMEDAKLLVSGSKYDKLVVVNSYKDNRTDSLQLAEYAGYLYESLIKREPSSANVEHLDAYLGLRSRIASGGNVRIQLMSAVI